MIAMYSGLRLNEICQLHKAEVQLVEGVHCFNVNSQGDKHLKISASVRLVQFIQS